MNDNTVTAKATTNAAPTQTYPIPVDKKVVNVDGREVELIKLADIGKELENKWYNQALSTKETIVNESNCRKLALIAAVVGFVFSVLSIVLLKTAPPSLGTQAGIGIGFSVIGAGATIIATAATILGVIRRKQAYQQFEKLFQLAKCITSYYGTDIAEIPQFKKILVNTHPDCTHISIDTVMSLYQTLDQQRKACGIRTTVPLSNLEDYEPPKVLEI